MQLNSASVSVIRRGWLFRMRTCMRHHQGMVNGSLKRMGVVIVDHGSRRSEANILLNQVVAAFQKTAAVEIVEPAHMEIEKPDIADALRACVDQGAEHVIVSPFFLSPGRHSQEDIPRLIEEAVNQFNLQMTYSVTEPIGTDPLIIDILQRRVDAALKG